MPTMKESKQVALIVLDGWGYREDGHHNAIAEAKTPFFDKLWNEYPHSTLDASEEFVGLPSGQIGNSEVGHMTIGAGRVIDTDLVRITKAMQAGLPACAGRPAQAGEFDTNPAFVKVFEHVKNNNLIQQSTLHLMGLVSPGGIHSHEEHLFGILRAAKNAGVKNIAIHVFTDGRDTPPQSSAESLGKLERVCREIGVGYIVTISGRFYAMDRDNNWERTEKAWAAITSPQTPLLHRRGASETVQELYKSGAQDEHLEPMVFKPAPISNGDGIIFFNFRPDRARQISKLILDIAKEKNLCFVTMTDYGKDFPAEVAFSSTHIVTTLAGEISKKVNLNKERVRQIKEIALRRLQRSFKNKLVKTYLS